MATDETLIVHPGDIVQDGDGLLYLVTETHRWGVGAVQRTRVGPVPYRIDETYTRLKPGQFVVVGTGHMLPEAVNAARRDSLRLADDVAREAAK